MIHFGNLSQHLTSPEWPGNMLSITKSPVVLIHSCRVQLIFGRTGPKWGDTSAGKPPFTSSRLKMTRFPAELCIDTYKSFLATPINPRRAWSRYNFIRFLIRNLDALRRLDILNTVNSSRADTRHRSLLSGQLVPKQRLIFYT